MRTELIYLYKFFLCSPQRRILPTAATINLSFPYALLNALSILVTSPITKCIAYYIHLTDEETKEQILQDHISNK